MHWIKKLSTAVTITALALCITTQIAGAADNDRQLIIKFRNSGLDRTPQSLGSSPLEALAQRGGHTLKLLRNRSSQISLVKLSASDPKHWEQTLSELNDDPNVEYAIEDKRMRPQFVPNDPLYLSEQWNLMSTPGGINMEPVWDPEGDSGSVNVTIGIVDTGYRPHPDFDATRIKAQHDFVDDDTSALDPGDGTIDNECDPGIGGEFSSWHGTSILGVIAASTNNFIDIAGIDNSAELVVARVLGKCGGVLSDTVYGMLWAAGIPVLGATANTHPADVINLSFASELPGPCKAFEQEAIDDVIAAGTVVVAAAGNSASLANDFSPANCDGVLTVTATDLNGRRASYANTGSDVDVSAPGGDGAFGIRTLSNNGEFDADTPITTQLFGTSMATAHATGIIALMKAARPTLPPAVLRVLLIDNTRPFPDLSCNTALCGSGIVDAFLAIQATLDAPEPKTAGGGCSINLAQKPDISLLLLLSGIFLFRNGCLSRL